MSSEPSLYPTDKQSCSNSMTSSYNTGDSDIDAAIEDTRIFSNEVIREPHSTTSPTTTTPGGTGDGAAAAEILRRQREQPSTGRSDIQDAIEDVNILSDEVINGESPVREPNNSTSIPPTQPIIDVVPDQSSDIDTGIEAFVILAAIGTALFVVVKKVVEGAATRAGEDFYNRVSRK